MRTRKRQKNWFFFRLITFTVIISFLSEGVAWTAPALRTNTISPSSKIPALATQFTAEYFLEKIDGWSKETVLTLQTLFNLLKKDIQDLNLSNINVLYSGSKLDLIGPDFTITFIDTILLPKEKIERIIQGTKIGFNIKIHRQSVADIPAQAMPQTNTNTANATKSQETAKTQETENLIISEDLNQTSRQAAEYFINEVKRLIAEKGKAVVCFATGNTPKGMYKIIRERYKDTVDWSKVISFNLDEYIFPTETGDLKNHAGSFRKYMQEELFNHIPIPEQNIHFLNGANPNIEEYKKQIKDTGGIDLCILGIGANGHIAFNEPGSPFDSTVRKIELTEATREANKGNFGGDINAVPTHALTMGIADIMASRKIMLIACGTGKADAVIKALYDPVTEQFPSSILQNHPNTKYFLDTSAFFSTEPEYSRSTTISTIRNSIKNFFIRLIEYMTKCIIRLSRTSTSSNAAFSADNSSRKLFEDMISSSKKLEEYIANGRIKEIIPEWEELGALKGDKFLERIHPLPFTDHILTAFKRIEIPYFRNLIKTYNFTKQDLTRLRIALFLHDFGLIRIKDMRSNYYDHPEESKKLAEEILKRLGYSLAEISRCLILIRFHNTLADFARYGRSDTNYMDFIRSLKTRNNLHLLKVLQLLDAGSVRELFENSLSEGIEKRINELTDILEGVLLDEGGETQAFLQYTAGIKNEYKIIHSSFSKLKSLITNKNINIDTDHLQRAFNAMNRSHLSQLRKDSITPYAIHPIKVAIILIEELGVTDEDIIIAALLHDVLEDTRTTEDVIRASFGDKVADIVTLLSKPDKTKYPSKHDRDKDYLRRLISGTDKIKDRKLLTAVQTIKIADRIHSLRNLKDTNRDFQLNIIEGTYHLFIFYFINETEVDTEIKKKLINELIESGRNLKILTDGQIEMLEKLSREIIDFKAPGKPIDIDPYNFMQATVEYLQMINPNRPPVLAFDGMSGAGKSEIAGKLKKQLEANGKKTVIFDARGYMLSREKRDAALKEALRDGIPYIEQREKLFDYRRFKKEVLNRIQSFRNSGDKRTTFTLHDLYDPGTGKTDIKNKPYVIDRDTVIIIEGMHLLQEGFMRYFDVTYLVYLPEKADYFNNVIQRESKKKEGEKQEPKKIRDRFEALDWPSYKRHWFEYWLGSGFILDNLDYNKLTIRRNRCLKYPEKAPFIPEELLDEKLDPLSLIFSSKKDTNLISQMLLRLKWKKLKTVSRCMVYGANGLCLKIPIFKISINSAILDFINKHTLLQIFNAVLTKFYYINFIRRFKEWIKYIIHLKIKPQKIIGMRYLKGYRLILEGAPHLIVPTLIIPHRELINLLGLNYSGRLSDAVLVQPWQKEFLIDRISRYVKIKDWANVEKIIDGAFSFTEQLWRYRLADIDMQIFENLSIDSDNNFKYTDADSIHGKTDKIKEAYTEIQKKASFVLELLKENNVREVLRILKKQDKNNFCIRVIKLLLKHLDKKDVHRVLSVFLIKLTEKITIENMEKHWGRNMPKNPPTPAKSSFTYPLCEADSPKQADYIGSPIIIDRELLMDTPSISADPLRDNIIKWLIKLDDISECLERFRGLNIQIVSGKFGYSVWRHNDTIFIGEKLIEAFIAVSNTPSLSDFPLYELYRILVHEKTHNGIASADIEDEFMEELNAILREVNILTDTERTDHIFAVSSQTIKNTLRKGWEQIARNAPALIRKTNIDDFNELVLADEQPSVFDIAKMLILKDNRFAAIREKVLDICRKKTLILLLTDESITLADRIGYLESNRLKYWKNTIEWEKKYLNERLTAAPLPFGKIELSDNLFVHMGEKLAKTAHYAVNRAYISAELLIKNTVSDNEAHIKIFFRPNESASDSEYKAAQRLRPSLKLPHVVEITIDDMINTIRYTLDEDEKDGQIYLYRNGNRVIPLKNEHGKFILDLEQIPHNLFLNKLYGRKPDLVKLLGQKTSVKQEGALFVYSLKALLESDLNTNKNMPLFEGLVRKCRENGNIVFYSGSDHILTPRYKELFGKTVIKKQGLLRIAQEKKLVVYMLDNEELNNLGLQDIPAARLTGNNFIIPLRSGQRDPFFDLYLGFAMLIANGKPENLTQAQTHLLSATLNGRSSRELRRILNEIISTEHSAPEEVDTTTPAASSA